MFHAPNPLAKTKCVAILLSKNSNFSVTDQTADLEGRYLFLKGSLNGQQTTLANVYFPNKAHISFCRKVVDELKWFSAGMVILGGDFKIPLNPLQDTSNGQTSIAYKTIKHIKSMLNSLMLMDSWRLVTPSEVSIPHDKYSRIDFIFITQRDLALLTEAKIGFQSLSDHSPIAISLALSDKHTKTCNWRLIPSLLLKPDILKHITESIKTYFALNSNNKTSPLRT